MNRIACPDCGGSLSRDAVKCRCGWKALKTLDGQPQADCSWEGCRQKAIVREEIEYGKGRHNLCEYHYLEANRLRAERWCEERGLHTLEQKKAFCRKMVGLAVKPMLQREPGEDDEREAA